MKKAEYAHRGIKGSVAGHATILGGRRVKRMVAVCILYGFGINSDYESQYAFQLAGADTVQRVHVNSLIHGHASLENFQILMFPGGFAFGNHLGSGRVLANKFRFALRDEITQFIQAGKLIFGVCNGFQVLVKMGVLPALDGQYFTQSVTLVGNKSANSKAAGSTCSPTSRGAFGLKALTSHWTSRSVMAKGNSFHKMTRRGSGCGRRISWSSLIVKISIQKTLTAQ